MTEQNNLLWVDLKTVGSVVDVFETCIDFGMNITASKKIAQKWKAQKGAVL